MIVLLHNNHFLLDNDPSSRLRFFADRFPVLRRLEPGQNPIWSDSHMKNLFRCLVGYFFAATLCVSCAWGQTVTGSVTGQVTDQSGAVVVGATVTAENTATRVKTSGQTNG